MSSVVENAAAYVAAQQDTAAQLPGVGLAELDAGRAAALEQLSRQGLPSQQDEDWKYTSTRSITRAAFKPASAGATCPSGLHYAVCYRRTQPLPHGFCGWVSVRNAI